MKLSHIISAALLLISANAFAECEDCTLEEGSSLQLNEALETVKILNKIKTEADELSPEAVKFYLGRIGTPEEVKELLKLIARPEPVERQNQKKKSGRAKPAKPKPLPKAKKELSKKRLGLEGLLVAHAQSENKSINYSATATLVSYGKAIPLLIGNTFSHNNSRYELTSITAYENNDKTVAHIVEIKNLSTGNKSTLPWNVANIK